MSAISNDSSLNEDHKIYWIKCSDGRFVSMNGEQLEILFDLMPTFRFLLLGHPSMKAKELLYANDGTPILEIPTDFCVSQDDFCMLVNVVFEAVPLPPRSKKYGSSSDLLTVLEQTMATLGGCEVLAQRLNGHHSNPSCPEEDTNGCFEWRVIHVSRTYDISLSDSDRLANAGYSYTGSVKDGIQMTHYYRKKRV